MVRFLDGRFVVSLSLLFCASVAIAHAAQGGIVYNALYDCGPGRNQFTVLGCNGNLCTIFYPKGNGGAGFRSTLGRESLAESIDGSYGGSRPPCRIAGKVVHAATHAKLHPAAPRRAQAPVSGGPIAAGRYECYTLSGGELEAAMMENFSIGNGRYRDAGGHAGSYSTSGGVITFHGGGLDGRRAVYVPGRVGSNNPPHVKFLLGRGGYGDECDGKG